MTLVAVDEVSGHGGPTLRIGDRFKDRETIGNKGFDIIEKQAQISNISLAKGQYHGHKGFCPANRRIEFWNIAYAHDIQLKGSRF